MSLKEDFVELENKIKSYIGNEIELFTRNFGKRRTDLNSNILISVYIIKPDIAQKKNIKG